MEQDYGNDFETNRKYLTFSWWLLHRGWTMIMNEVEAAVKDVFAPLTPRDNVTFEKLSELVVEVRKKIEGSSEEERRTHKWLEYLLPSTADEELVLRESVMSQSSPPGTPLAGENLGISPSLRRLLDETSDLVESPTFTHVLTLVLDSSFSLLIDDKIATQAYNISPTQRRPSVASNQGLLSAAASAIATDENRIQEITEEEADSMPADIKQKTAKLATILAVFTRQAHTVGSGGNMNALMGVGGPGPHDHLDLPMRESNEYLTAMESIGDLEAFAAVVYSSNFEFEGVEGTDAANSATEVAGPPTDFLSSGEQKLENAWDKAFSKQPA